MEKKQRMVRMYSIKQERLDEVLWEQLEFFLEVGSDMLLDTAMKRIGVEIKKRAKEQPNE